MKTLAATTVSRRRQRTKRKQHREKSPAERGGGKTIEWNGQERRPPHQLRVRVKLC